MNSLGSDRCWEIARLLSRGVGDPVLKSIVSGPLDSDKQIISCVIAGPEKLQDVTARFKKAGDIDYMRMSVAAKTYFMLQKSGKPASPAQLSESAKELGWNATAEDIKESISFLEKLGLVKREAEPKRGLGEAHDRQSD